MLMTLKLLHGFSTRHRQIMSLGIVSLAVAIVGTMLLTSSHAATQVASYEAESGTSSANASTVLDSTASGNQAIKFSTSASASTCPSAKRTLTAADVTNKLNSGYAAGTQVYVPNGPDPWGGCFPGPGNTSVPTGTTLTSLTTTNLSNTDVCTTGGRNIYSNADGKLELDCGGTVIDGKTISESIVADNGTGGTITIKNSKITAGDIENDGTGTLLIEDSEVDFGSDVNTNALTGSNITVLRSNMHNGKRQVWCSHCSIQDSYFHDQLSDPTGVTHESAARADAYTTFEHDTFLCNASNYPPDAGCSADQTGYPDFGPTHDNTFDKNLYMATTGGYCSYGGDSNGKPYSSDPSNAINIHFTNNVFARGTTANDRTTLALTDRNRYTCGYYGVTTSFNSSKAGFVFSGNMWDDGLLFTKDTSYPYGGFYY